MKEEYVKLLINELNGQYERHNKEYRRFMRIFCKSGKGTYSFFNGFNKCFYYVKPEDYDECETILKNYFKSKNISLIEKEVRNDNVYAWFKSIAPNSFIYLKGYKDIPTRDRHQYVKLLKNDFSQLNEMCPTIISIVIDMDYSDEYKYEPDEKNTFAFYKLFDDN